MTRRHPCRRLLLWALITAGLAPGLASGAPLLWTVADDNSRLYLAGSLHLLPDRAYPLDAAYNRAYADSKTLVLEADLRALRKPVNQTRLLAGAQADASTPLRERIGDDLYQRVRLHAERLALPLFSLDALQPWYVGLLLELSAYQRAGFTAERGLDQHFTERAVADGKRIVGLETVDQHLALLTGLGDDDSTTTLEATVDQLARDGRLPETVFEAWSTGDFAALGELVDALQRDHPRAYVRLLANRNRSWIERLTEILADRDNALVIVGAAHFPGDDGLIALLREAGLTVERVE